MRPRRQRSCSLSPQHLQRGKEEELSSQTIKWYEYSEVSQLNIRNGHSDSFDLPSGYAHQSELSPMLAYTLEQYSDQLVLAF